MAAEKVFISEAAQTVFCDSETQFLNWDITCEPTKNPSNFPRGRGLHYPVLYDPAWPVYIAAPKKEVKPLDTKTKVVVGSYALKGVTLSETERKPIKKTLLFPHRNTDLPFRQPRPRDFREPTYERCESLTLQVIQEMEPIIAYMSILRNMPKYDKNDKKACAKAIRKVFRLGPGYIEDQGPPVPRRRKARRGKSQTKAKGAKEEEKKDIKPLEIIFVDEGERCKVHGDTIDVVKVKNCEIHGDIGIYDENGPKEEG